MSLDQWLFLIGAGWWLIVGMISTLVSEYRTQSIVVVIAQIPIWVLMPLCCVAWLANNWATSEGGVAGTIVLAAICWPIAAFLMHALVKDLRGHGDHEPQHT